MNEIKYEWDYETVIDGEVEDHDHADKLVDFHESAKTDTLVLVRDVGNDIDGLLDRSWAYVNDGKLPEYFQDAHQVNTHKVPQRFHKELAKYLSTTK